MNDDDLIDELISNTINIIKIDLFKLQKIQALNDLNQKQATQVTDYLRCLTAIRKDRAATVRKNDAILSDDELNDEIVKEAEKIKLRKV